MVEHWLWCQCCIRGRAAVNLFYCNVKPNVVTSLLTFGKEPSVINAVKCLAELKPSPVETSTTEHPKNSTGPYISNLKRWAEKCTEDLSEAKRLRLQDVWSYRNTDNLVPSSGLRNDRGNIFFLCCSLILSLGYFSLASIFPRIRLCNSWKSEVFNITVTCRVVLKMFLK